MEELKKYKKTTLLTPRGNLWERFGELLFAYRFYLAGGFFVLVLATAIVLGVLQERRSRGRALSFELARAMEEYDSLYAQAITMGPRVYEPVRKQLEDLYGKARGTSIYPLVLIYLYHIHLEQRNYDAALGLSQELREVTRSQPRLLAVALYQIGKTYEFLGDNNTAILFYRQAQDVQGSPFGEFLAEEIKRLEQPALPLEVVQAFTGEITAAAPGEATKVSGKIMIPLKELLERGEK